MSHVFYLNVGKAWQRSETSNTWRQQVCLQRDLYDSDVTGQQIAEALQLPQQLLTPSYWPPRLDVSGFKQTLQVEDRYALGFELQHWSSNQLASVRQICANRNATSVLLIVAIYAILQRFVQRGSITRIAVRLCGVTVWSAVLVFGQAVSGLLSLAFYYYDLVTALIVLDQVWGTWPGDVLAGIFFFHFTMTAEIVLFHALQRLTALWTGTEFKQAHWSVLFVTLTVIASPLMIPVVLVLDTIALAREILVCATELPGCRKLRAVQFAADKAVVIRRLRPCWVLSWIDLEKYDSMHNLVAALCQSLPTVILNSIVFYLGNEPGHGFFLSTGLFVVAIIASCLAILKVLIVTLWEAHEHKAHPVKYAARLFVGSMLAGHVPSTTGAADPVALKCLEQLTQQYVVSGSAPLGDPCLTGPRLQMAPQKSVEIDQSPTVI